MPILVIRMINFAILDIPSVASVMEVTQKKQEKFYFVSSVAALQICYGNALGKYEPCMGQIIKETRKCIHFPGFLIFTSA